MKNDRLLTALAVAMTLMAISNCWKPIAQAFAPDTNAGFVFLGHRLTGTANAIAGPLFGAFLATYAVGVWKRRRWVVPIAVAYAAYVIVNLVAFVTVAPPEQIPSLAFMFVYAVVAIGVSSGGAWLLVHRREELT